ncbi:MAG: TetR/AcrR family transcriptional regulator [Proteobacteria bacterium]|nr:TetR/AcrR family transcriptional regulator [Pseudomonadota bacterium]
MTPAANTLDTPPRNARERSRLETRRRLLMAGAELIANDGLASARATDIAAAAGVAVGTLYFHFGDKDGLLEAILLHGVDLLTERLRTVVDNPHDTLTAAVRAHEDEMLAFIEEEPTLARVLFHNEVRATEVGTRIFELGVELQAERLRAGVADGFFRNDLHADITARAIVGMLSAVLTWWAADPSRASRQDVVDTLTAMRVGGLHHPEL